MTNTVIKIEGLGKKYLLAHKSPQRYIALRDVLVDRAKRLGRRLRHPFVKSAGERNPTVEDFWALSDLSFEVKEGERVGVIGRNGAGKSTLLKVLSRITEPTTGRVSLRGRVASLLEVGTGFHPELTGRENIYLNGAILGMSKAEIRRNFDAIVDFAGVEKFLDTPVKRYSSGMYVRLAFAVAAHLDTEILMIDEVLAVGDAEFQKKCMGKMDEVSHKQGRTILFVSHNMEAVQRLCSRGVFLQDGRLQFSGTVVDAVKKYKESQGVVQSFSNIEHVARSSVYPGEYVKILTFGIFDGQGRENTVFRMGEDIVFHLGIRVLQRVKKLELGIGFRNSANLPVRFLVSSWDDCPYALSAGEYRFEITAPEINLFPSTYSLNCWAMLDGGTCADDNVSEVANIEVIEYDITGNFTRFNIANTFSVYDSDGHVSYGKSLWRMI